MNQNNLPPSPFVKGTAYDAEGKQIQRPPQISRIVEQERATDAPDTTEAIGAIAVQGFVSIADLQPPATSPYVDRPASRQADLDRAEVQNIIRAAAEAGMSVDQWKAARGRR